MNLGRQDLHLIFAPHERTLKVFDAKGSILIACECRNLTVKNDGHYGHWSPCPPGLYRLARPATENTPPFGPWFVGMEDFNDHHSMRDHGRSGIGIHGGGSGLPSPMAPRQSPPWVVTHGCLRVLNIDLAKIVHLVQGCQKQGGTAYIDVLSIPKTAPQAQDDYLPIDPDQLEPQE